MTGTNLMEAGARLADHLRSLGVNNPIVGAGGGYLFIYALRKDKARIGDLREWEGVKVTIRVGGPVRPLAA